MKAAIYREYRGPITVETLPNPVPHTDGVVLRVAANGICRSDWHGWVGHDPDIVLPHVPGTRDRRGGRRGREGGQALEGG